MRVFSLVSCGWLFFFSLLGLLGSFYGQAVFVLLDSAHSNHVGLVLRDSFHTLASWFLEFSTWCLHSHVGPSKVIVEEKIIEWLLLTIQASQIKDNFTRKIKKYVALFNSIYCNKYTSANSKNKEVRKLWNQYIIKKLNITSHTNKIDSS